MSKHHAAAVVARPRARRLLVLLTSSIAFVAIVASASAVHWPFYGGDAGRSGYQPVQEPTTPIVFQYQKGNDAGEAGDRNIQNSIVTTTGDDTSQRFAYGTEGDAALAGNAHLQILGTGAPVGPENGILVDSGTDDPDTFRPTGTVGDQCSGGPSNVTTNLQSAGIAFADSSTAGGLGQLFVLHNDNDQDGTNDVAVSIIDEASATQQDLPIGTTDGFTVFSSPVLSAAQTDDPNTANVNETGNRNLYFVACRSQVEDNTTTPGVDESRPFEVRLFRVAITNNASTINATLGMPTSVVIPNGNPIASPTLLNLTNGNDTTGYVAVSAGGSGPSVQTFQQDTLVPGPVSGDLGDAAQTPSVAVTGTGGPDPSSDEIYVAVGQTPTGGNASTTNTRTRVFRLTFTPATTPALVVAPGGTADSPLLEGIPAPALAVNEEAGEADGDVVVTTSLNLFVLDAEDLDDGDRLYFGDAATPADGFSRTTAAVAGDLGFVTTDGGRQLVVRLANADRVSGQEFTQTTGPTAATFSTGQPSISRRFVQYQTNQGAFVYRGTGAQFSINDVEVVEGDSATRNATFTITRTGSTAESQSVTVNTSNGPAPAATSGQDYQALSNQVVTFAAGETSKQVDVVINGDTTPEADERFTVTLSNPTSAATISDATGTGTILDDDDETQMQTTFSIGDATVTEGDAGTTAATFTITKSGPDAASVTVNTANGTATAPSDYTARTGVVVAFTAAETTKTFTVDVNGDTADENDETFTVNLSNPTDGATVSDASGTGLIADDDTQMQTTFSIGDATVTEGDAGTTAATFTITKSGPEAASVTVDTADGTATAPGDYTARSGVVVAFTAAETTKTITVDVQGDTSDENDETFTVNLSNPTNSATVSDASGTGLIADDDEPIQPAEPDPTVSISDNSGAEGDSGTSGLAFTVSLSRPADKVTTVNYATSPGTAGAPGDFTATSGTVTFAAGEQNKTITIPIVGDVVDEANEAFKITLSAPSNATLGDAEGTGTIVDDDRAVISINDATVTEGDIDAVMMTFTITLSTPAASEVAVNYATGDGAANNLGSSTATAGEDYTPVNGTVRFAPGETSKTISVPILGDRIEEATERFVVTLSGAVNAGVVKSVGVGSIADDEAAPRVSISGLSAKTTPRRDRTKPFRFTTTGRLLLPAGITERQACNVGRVSVTFKVVRKTVSTRRANLQDDCRFRSRVTLDKRSRLGKGILTVEVRWLGNGDLKPFGPKRYKVRAG